MGKTLYVKYLHSIRNIGVYLTVCVAHEVWVSPIYNFQDTFHRLSCGDEGKGKDD